MTEPSTLLRLDAGEFDDFAPLVGFRHHGPAKLLTLSLSVLTIAEVIVLLALDVGLTNDATVIVVLLSNKSAEIGSAFFGREQT